MRSPARNLAGEADISSQLESPAIQSLIKWNVFLSSFFFFFTSRTLILTFKPRLVPSPFQSNYKLLSQIVLLWIHCSLDEEKLQRYDKSKLAESCVYVDGR